MNCKLLVFRHTETYDNQKQIFSGWRDSDLNSKGLEQAKQIAEQLRSYRIDYAFTSHLKRSKKTLSVVAREHPLIAVFKDDRLIERCYGLLQGKRKIKLQQENPEWYANIHRGYDFAPPEGESLKMVENRVLPFLFQLKEWLNNYPGNVAISCHSNSIRPIRRVFERLSLKQMLRLENPQDKAFIYNLEISRSNLKQPKTSLEGIWKGIIVPSYVKLATNRLNPLKIYY